MIMFHLKLCCPTKLLWDFWKLYPFYMRIQARSFFVFHWTTENTGRCRRKQEHSAIEVLLEHCALSFMYLLCLIQATDFTQSFISLGNTWFSGYRDYQALFQHRLGISWIFTRSERNWKLYSSAVTDDFAHAPFAKIHYSECKKLSMKDVLSSTVTRRTVARVLATCPL